MRAGDWASSVPDLLVAEGRLGLRIDEDPDAARRELEERVAEVAAARPLPARPPAGGDAGPAASSPAASCRPGHPLRDLVLRGARRRHRRRAALRERGAPYGSDLRLYAGAGIPTLHYGPGDVRLAHGPDEAVDARRGGPGRPSAGARRPARLRSGR